ncbi:MAG TPA: toll/interleukin-1 receptor domain-containing protein, partial [Phototrophicaceae bacterium]|nr:toll/interleukin-1 receptor domain-containing protein [Phototrophicaceae bacterium]
MSWLLEGIAVNLAYDLLKQGASLLHTGLRGDPQLRTLHAAYKQAFQVALETILKDASSAEIENTERELKRFIQQPGIRHLLLDIALSERRPALDELQAEAGITFSLLTLRVMDAFLAELVVELRVQAEDAESPLYNLVSLGKLEQINQAVKALPDDVRDVKTLLLRLLEQPAPISDYLLARTTAPIFISYSRANTEFASNLTEKLVTLQFHAWRDRHELAGGDDWWRQIQEAIEAADTMVLCMSPHALASKFIADEWHHARRMGKRVIPVVAEAVDFDIVPRWMQRAHWFDFRPEAAEADVQWRAFITQLNTLYLPRQVPFMAEDLKDFVARPTEYEALVRALVDEKQGAVAI